MRIAVLYVCFSSGGLSFTLFLATGLGCPWRLRDSGMKGLLGALSFHTFRSWPTAAKLEEFRV